MKKLLFEIIQEKKELEEQKYKELWNNNDFVKKIRDNKNKHVEKLNLHKEKMHDLKIWNNNDFVKKIKNNHNNHKELLNLDKQEKDYTKAWNNNDFVKKIRNNHFKNKNKLDLIKKEQDYKKAWNENSFVKQIRSNFNLNALYEKNEVKNCFNQTIKNNKSKIDELKQNKASRNEFENEFKTNAFANKIKANHEELKSKVSYKQQIFNIAQNWKTFKLDKDDYVKSEQKSKFEENKYSQRIFKNQEQVFFDPSFEERKELQRLVKEIQKNKKQPIRVETMLPNPAEIRKNKLNQIKNDRFEEVISKDVPLSELVEEDPELGALIEQLNAVKKVKNELKQKNELTKEKLSEVEALLEVNLKLLNKSEKQD